MSLYKFEFDMQQFNAEYNTITVNMTKEFFMDNIKYKLDNEQDNIPDVIVVSPTGAEKVFSNPTMFAGGLRYYNGKVNLKLIY